MAERTIGEIIEAVQEGKPATEQELRLALLSVYYDDQMAGPHDFETASNMVLRVRAKDNFERRFRMMRQTPTHWLGEGLTPGTAENKERRRISFAVLDAVKSKKGVDW